VAAAVIHLCEVDSEERGVHHITTRHHRSRRTVRKYTASLIRLSGKWLDRMGFNEGARARVPGEVGQLAPTISYWKGRKGGLTLQWCCHAAVPNPALRASKSADVMASRSLQFAPSGHSVSCGSERAASLARHAGRAQHTGRTLGRRSNPGCRPFQLTELRERVPADTNSPATTAASHAEPECRAGFEHALGGGTGAYLPRFVPGEAKRGSATGAQQGGASP
jgi:hypothetical protein